MDRNCDKCIHHTSGMCDSWDCKMQTVEDLKKEVREKAIEEFAERIRGYAFGVTEIIDRVAKELKGE